MADNDVTLTIKVKDEQVKQAEASLNRLNKAAQNVGNGPTFKPNDPDAVRGLSQQEKLAKFLENNIPKAAQQATDALQETAGATESVGSAAAAAGPSLLAMAGGVLAVVGVITLLVAGLYEAGKTVVNTTKQFADYSIEVANSAEATGLATNTIVALNHEMEAGGRTAANYAGAVENFRKEIGQAASGSTDARQKLNLLGIDGTKAINNIDGAFKQAIATIVKAPTEVEKVRLSVAAFGDDGYKLIPFFQQFNGNVDAAIKKAEELGLIISGKDVDAAREFNRAYADLNGAIKGITDTFGREFAPIVTKALQDFNQWLLTNKETIKDWARWTADSVKSVVEWWEKAAGAIENYNKQHAQAVKFDAENAFPNANQYPLGLPKGDSQPSQTVNAVRIDPTTGKTFDPNKPFPTPDPGAIAAQMEEARKRAEAELKDQQATAAATIQYYENEAKAAVSAVDKVFSDLQKQLTNSGDTHAFAEAMLQQLSSFLGTVNNANEQLRKAEDAAASLAGKNEAERKVLAQQQNQREQDTSDKYIEIVQKSNDAILKSDKKTSDDRVKLAETELRKKLQLDDDATKHQIDNFKYLYQTGNLTEETYLKSVGAAELEELNKRFIALTEFKNKNKLNALDLAKVNADIAKAQADIDQRKIDNERILTQEQVHRLDVLNEIKRIEAQSPGQQATDAANEEKLQLTREIADLNAAIANSISGVNDGLIIQSEHLKDVLYYRQQELNAVIEINRAQEALSHSMEISGNVIKAQVLDHLARQKTLNEAIADGINETYDAVAQKLDDQIDKMFQWAGAFKSLFTEPLKAFARNSMTNFTTKILDAVFPGLGDKFQDATANPIAKPIVDKVSKTNEKLDTIIRLMGGSGSGISLGGLNLGSIFGGSAGGGIFNLGGGSAGVSGHAGPETGAAAGGGSIFDRIKNLFSTNEGGIFAPRATIGGGTSRMGGILGGIGDIANVIGGAIGGKVGGVLQLAGTGASIGAMFGPWGAVIGAAAGAILGLFGPDPKRKADHDTNIPNLQKGFGEAITQLNQILDDIRHMNIDPDSAVSQARDIRNQIAGGFGIKFESKKYQKIAQQQIQSQLVQADSIIQQIMASADIARGAADRSKRILPEFATGYFADFFRPNGMIPGAFDGADNILAMISRGEMVLNPSQQARARAAAGFDVFASAGIPNYPKASSSARLATGGVAGAGLALAASPQIHLQPRFTLVLQGDVFDDKAAAFLVSDDGLRTQVQVQKRLTERGGR